MKKSSKIISLCLVSSFLGIGNVSLINDFGEIKPLEESSSIKYEDNFDYKGFSAGEVFDGKILSNEVPESGNNASFTSKTPVVENGVAKLEEGASIQFNWLKIDGFSFDSTKTYTLTFDVKVTDFGDNIGIRDVWKREMYVAPGGYYNQIELRNDNGDNKVIRTGDTWGGITGTSYKLNTTYKAKLVWEPASKKITSTLYEGENEIQTGFRTNNAYANADAQLSNWIIRCEDGAIEVDNLSYTDGTNVYNQVFDGTAEPGCMTSSGLWALETVEKRGTAPKIEHNTLSFVDTNSIAFNWMKVDGIEGFSSDLSYNFSFDLKVTNLGDGTNMGVADQTRVMYLANGGYYNQVELLTQNNKVRTGDTYVDFVESTYLNKYVHVEMVWEGTSITSTIYDSDGKVLQAGSRMNSIFTNMSDHSKCMTYIVIRCEDGAFDLSNFKFEAKVSEKSEETLLPIEVDKETIYECKVDIEEGSKVTLKINSAEFFNYIDGKIRLCGYSVNGDYESGEYSLKANLNLEQKMFSLEVVLPSGGIIRRGTSGVIDFNASKYSIDVYKDDNVVVSDIKTSTNEVIVRDYSLEKGEPEYDGIDASIYNVITSFDDASTTRRFAFTVLESYASGDDIVLKYKPSNSSDDYIEVEATREEENVNSTEDYYKVFIEDLIPNTEYEYRITKASENDENEWTSARFFKTAPEKIDEFKFVAVGDTQGITWNGTNPSVKGFMYAKAAYEAAMEEVEDASFIMNTGDIVENGDNVNQWNYFFKALGDYGASIPHFAAIGNHDTVKLPGSKPLFYFSLHFNHPKNGGTDYLDIDQTKHIKDVNLLAMSNNAEETFYSYNYGDSHFVVLNSGRYSADDYYLLEAQRSWLEEDLDANSNARWTIIMVHEPVYHRVGGKESRPWLYDVIESHNVDLLIQGHSHLVTRSYPMKDGKIVSKENVDRIEKGTGTVYTTIGSTTLNHDSLGNPSMEEMMLIKTPEMEQATYTTVEVTKKSIIMTIKQLNGLVVDKFEIYNNANDEEPVNPTPTPNNNKNPNVGLIVGISAGAAALIGAGVVATLLILKKKKH